ncbi:MULTISPECIES: acetyl-CoA C-acetyltransferase [unclassified Streptomyces]|uniref:Acetyl-CoA C-acetyltransferase n=1 Tax=Streptomyces sp. NBC_00119 TaxID=2975659 RepID=A0AAU1U3Q7_9ACTN|nr:MULTISPECIES: acetyl-CoA C-acetyltransferase [unclassified Streptomyces]WSE08797.1 acetyl-CoA C-acetyltransferase [Streptomyces sp. NBC_01445]WSE13466.1 acetyl-CoA C-acetyltransferase [Streptomyces sp. NBC_01397]WUB97618.1 acetyl-CoA C-acetyltransferase [Streptomyces sp. NBC_00569]
MPEAVVVAAARTPIGRAFKGSLKEVRPDDLAAAAIRATLDQVPALDPTQIDDLHLGCAEPSGEHGGNMARRVAVQLGLDEVPGTTVNRFCSSSLQTARMAFHAIKAGEGHAFISAGVECVSRYQRFGAAGADSDDVLNPAFDQARARTANDALSNQRWTNPRADGQLPDIYLAMGQTAENVGGLRQVGRREQDDYAVRSQQLAAQAANSGFFAREITPVRLPDGTMMVSDDSPRPGTTIEALAQLKPAFRPGGTVTAGNSCPLNDGAAAVIIMSDIRARELGITPLARIVATGVSGLSPEIMGLGPVEATRRALTHAGLSIGDIDLFEMNEAFAAQVIASQRELRIPVERLNVHGGAIALGHPFGATGARIMTTLINGLRTRDAQWGVETMCVGGGQGMAMVLERLS